MCGGASGEPSKRKGQETLPSQNPQPNAITAALWTGAVA